MEIEDEYRELISSLGNYPEQLDLFVRILEVKKRKLRNTIENSKDREELWDNKTRLNTITEISREIISHSKN